MSSFEDFTEDFSYFDDDYEDQTDLEFRNRALSEPDFDYFLHARPLQPKREIGEYVAENGFSVPLIQDQAEVAKAVDESVLMIRSEMAQDYSGLGGLFSSYAVHHALDRDAGFSGDTEFKLAFRELIKTGLKTGEITLQEYMERFHPYSDWKEAEAKLLEESMLMGLRELPIDTRVSASPWRYVEGTNISMFRDPHVDGRYHFGVTPHNQSVGDYIFELGEHDKEQTFRKHRQPFVAEPFIEMYERIRALPLFDVTQVPVLELQQATDGTIHFLQYRRVDKSLNITDPFDLPEEGFRTENVRGITGQDGEDVKLFINPVNIQKVIGDGIFGDFFYFGNHSPLRTQITCKLARIALCEDWISFKDNHSSAAPLFLPELAIGLYGADETSWPTLEVFRNLRVDFPSLHRRSNGEYFQVHVTSNGREAVLQSDWQINT